MPHPADAEVAAEFDLASDRSLDEHRLTAGDRAIDRDECFAVRVAEHVLAVDCDRGGVAVVNEFRRFVRAVVRWSRCQPGKLSYAR